MARLLYFIVLLFATFSSIPSLIQGLLSFPVSVDKVQKLLLSAQNLRKLKSQPNLPVSFSLDTNCTHWLQKSGDAIIYNFGVEYTSSSAHKLRDCLRRDEAAASRNRIRQVIVAFPLSGEQDRAQEALFDIVDMLSNLESIRGRHARQALKDKKSDNGNSWIVNVDVVNEPNYFIECNSETLKVDSSYGTGGSRNGVDHLYNTLIECQNARSVSLSISQGGCLIDDDPFSFPWRAGDRLPDLENLTLSGYDWEPWVSPWSEHSRPSSARAWKNAMDWGKLKRLDIDRPPNSFLEAFHGELSDLESLVLRPRWAFWGDEVTLCSFNEDGNELRQNYTSFITALPPLRELSISGMGELLNLTPILETHGTSLEKLKIHELEHDCTYETGNSTWTRPSLTVAEIKQLNAAAPNLQSLTLDVYRSNNDWPITILKALSAFPNLSHLTLSFDLEDPQHRRYTKECWTHGSGRDKYCMVNELMLPLLNQTSAIEIFQSLRREQRETMPGNDNNTIINKLLEKLTVSAGDYGRQTGGGLRLTEHCDYPRPVRYECWIKGEEREVCEGRAGINYKAAGYCGYEDMDELDDIWDNNGGEP